LTQSTRNNQPRGTRIIRQTIDIINANPTLGLWKLRILMKSFFRKHYNSPNLKTYFELCLNGNFHLRWCSSPTNIPHNQNASFLVLTLNSAAIKNKCTSDTTGDAMKNHSR
jgi:hypothetical protein